MAIQISGTTVIDNSRNLTNISNASTLNCANTYVIRDASGAICVSATSCSLNYATPLGSATAGGYLICKSGNVAWIVSPRGSEVSRSWYCRNDAITTAQSSSGGCTGWFIPTFSVHQNPGRACRDFWDNIPYCPFWSSSDYNTACAYVSNYSTGQTQLGFKPSNECVRAFRCVTY